VSETLLGLNMEKGDITVQPRLSGPRLSGSLIVRTFFSNCSHPRIALAAS